MTADKWQIQPVCKTCEYRKLLDGKAPLLNWQNTYCSYFLETGERRDGQPQGKYCPNYKRK